MVEPIAQTDHGAPAAAKLKVFISYSRKDAEAFADELSGGLDFNGNFEVSLDRHSIVEGEDWRKRLGALIADADTVVYVVSPGSVASDVCRWEIEEATRLSKRILPVLWIAPEDGQRVPERLSELHYTRFDGGRSFISGLKALVTALNTDIGWLREHTRLLARAREWENASRVENRMLTGPDIEAAKTWAARRPKGAPDLTPQHLDFIRASELAEIARNTALARQHEERARLLQEAEIAAEERKRALTRAEEALELTVRLQRRQAIAAAIALLVLSLGGWWGYGVYTERLATRAEREAIEKEAARTDIRGQVVAYATARGETAADTAQGFETSPYSTILSRKLAQPNRSIVDALVDAHKEVSELSAFRQRPYLSTSVNGHIYLAKPPPGRKQKAILVAVDDANVGPHAILRAPWHDVNAIRSSLLTMGFTPAQIVTLHNVDAATIRAAIDDARRDFAATADNRNSRNHSQVVKVGIKPITETAIGSLAPNTLLVFFFSGHGVEINGQDLIVPRLAEGSSASTANVESGGITTTQLTRIIDDIAAASVVILDTHFPRYGSGEASR